MLVKLMAGREKDAALFTRNGKPIKDYRAAWDILTKDLTGGSGKAGRITIHDLRGAIMAMSNKGIGAAEAGTPLHLSITRRRTGNRSEDRG